MLRTLVGMVVFLSTAVFAEDFTFTGQITAVGGNVNSGQYYVESTQGNFDVYFDYSSREAADLCMQYLFEKMTNNSASVQFKNVELSTNRIGFSWYSKCIYRANDIE